MILCFFCYKRSTNQEVDMCSSFTHKYLKFCIRVVTFNGRTGPCSGKHFLLWRHVYNNNADLHVHQFYKVSVTACCRIKPQKFIWDGGNLVASLVNPIND